MEAYACKHGNTDVAYCWQRAKQSPTGLYSYGSLRFQFSICIAWRTANIIPQSDECLELSTRPTQSCEASYQGQRDLRFFHRRQLTAEADATFSVNSKPFDIHGRLLERW